MKSMKVYRFLPAKWAKAALIENRLKCSLLNELNDPFELLTFSCRSHVHRRAFDRLKTTLSEKKALLCCSKNWSNPIIWSHYAEQHTGICLELELIDDKYGREVEYISSRIPFDGKLSLKVTDKVLYSKFEHWKYEEEYRLAVDANHREDGKVFVDLGGILKFTKVILGARCGESISVISRLAKDRGHQLDVIKGRISLQEFKIEAETQEHRDYDEYLVSNEWVDCLSKRVPKVGRNEQCPCGSTLKYKMCHGR